MAQKPFLFEHKSCWNEAANQSFKEPTKKKSESSIFASSESEAALDNKTSRNSNHDEPFGEHGYRTNRKREATKRADTPRPHKKSWREYEIWQRPPWTTPAETQIYHRAAVGAVIEPIGYKSGQKKFGGQKFGAESGAIPKQRLPSPPNLRSPDSSSSRDGDPRGKRLSPLTTGPIERGSSPLLASLENLATELPASMSDNSSKLAEWRRGEEVEMKNTTPSLDHRQNEPMILDPPRAPWGVAPRRKFGPKKLDFSQEASELCAELAEDLTDRSRERQAENLIDRWRLWRTDRKKKKKKHERKLWASDLSLCSCYWEFCVRKKPKSSPWWSENALCCQELDHQMRHMNM